MPEGTASEPLAYVLVYFCVAVIYGYLTWEAATRNAENGREVEAKIMAILALMAPVWPVGLIALLALLFKAWAYYLLDIARTGRTR
jgi:nicotinamide riboside transporter PnuC